MQLTESTRDSVGTCQRWAKVLILGDSHGRHYAEGVSSIISKPHELPLYLSAGTSCLHLPGFTRTTPGKDWDARCANGLQKALDYLNSSDENAIVILSHAWTFQRDRAALLDERGNRKDKKVSNEDVFQGISDLKRLLGNHQLMVIGEVPGAHYDMYHVFSRPKFLSRVDREYFERSPEKEEKVAFNYALRQFSKTREEFIFIDPHEAFCERTTCRNLDDQGNILYSDRGHLSRNDSKFVISKFESVFSDALNKP